MTMTTPTPATMWALTFDRDLDGWTTSRGFKKREVPRPSLDEAANPADTDYALVRVKVAGVCGSDRGIWFRHSFRDLIHNSLAAEGKSLRTIGHEFVGEVVAIGTSAAQRTGLVPGDIVAAESHIICGECVQCKEGNTQVCEFTKILGISHDGCFAEMIKLPAKCLWKTDMARIRREIAAVQEPFGNAVHVCTTVPLESKTVAVFGTGTIGLFAVAIAKAMGAAKVIAIEPDPRHGEMARSLGADEVIAVDRDSAPKGTVRHDPALVARVLEKAGPEGVAVSFEMYGSNASVNNAIAATRKGGHVVLFGLHDGDFTIENFNRIIIDGIQLHGVVGRRVFETWEVTRSLLESQTNQMQDRIWNIILNGGVGTMVPFREWEASSFEQMIRSNPKVLIDFEA